VAFFRFNRDKRGYEHFYLVEPASNRRGKAKPRVLYWFRTPPGVRVGREPFDEDVRRALEAQHPGVTFDWQSIVEAPIPSADAEKWRERRRAERAAKHAMASADVDDEPTEETTNGEQLEASSDAADDDAPQEPGTSIAAIANEPAPQNGVDSVRKRRRRRRGRRPGAPPAPGGSSSEPPEAAAGESNDSEPSGD
jgi:hypothetical protein